MNISILTLFPQLYTEFLQTSLIGRAKDKGLIKPDLKNLFDFCVPKERIDSPTFGHGAGMLIRPDVIEKGIEEQEQKFGSAFKIFFSPQGKKLTQPLLKDLIKKISDKNHLMLIASRYEGIDARVEEYYADEIISLGDFVIMGGDLPAMVFLEGLLRLVPGIVGKQESVEEESFSGPFLDYPEYTAPVVWKGMDVPEIIRSGNHALIQEWRTKKAAEKTVLSRFDWLRSFELDEKQKNLTKEFIPNHYAVLMHGDVLLKGNLVGTTSVTSLDIHDIARSSLTYNLKNYFIVTPLEDQQKVVKTLTDFWQTGVGVDYNIHRHQSIERVRLQSNLDEVVDFITKQEGKAPLLIATSAKSFDHLNKITYHDQTRVWAEDRPVLFIFGTGHGLAPHILERCDFLLEPIYSFSDFNHLSVRSAVAVILDRWLGLNPKYKSAD